MNRLRHEHSTGSPPVDAPAFVTCEVCWSRACGEVEQLGGPPDAFVDVTTLPGYQAGAGTAFNMDGLAPAYWEATRPWRQLGARQL